MRYLVVLTVTEAKKFIAKTLVRKSDKFKRAFDQGRVVLHPSTSTVFIYEELMGKMPDGMKFIGAIAPKGTCISKEFEVIAAERKKNFDQKHVTYSWIFDKGQQLQGLTLELDGTFHVARIVGRIIELQHGRGQKDIVVEKSEDRGVAGAVAVE